MDSDLSSAQHSDAGRHSGQGRKFVNTLRSLLLRGLLPVSLMVSIVIPASALAAPGGFAQVEFGPGREDWKAAFSAVDLDGIFQSVAREIRYEPYPGIMRGAAGTAIAGAGNAWDQSLLLAKLLSERGYRVRFARGELDSGNRAVLLRGLYPPSLPQAGLSFDFTAYDPLADPELNRVAKDHLWVEVAQDDGWLPLDPAFPRAQAGESYAAASEYFETPPEQYEQRLTIRLKQLTAGGEARELLTDAGPVQSFALRPVWLTIMASPLMPAEKKRRAATLSFGSPEPKDNQDDEAAPVRMGTNYHWAYGLDGTRRKGGAVTVLDDQPGLAISREWLEMTIEYPGGQAQVVERDLRAPAGDKPAAYRRYQLLVAPGRVTTEHVEQVTARVRTGIDLEAMRESLAAVSSDDKIDAALELEQLTGNVAPSLLALRFAAESDAMSDRIAWTNGVALVHNRPRLIITSVSVPGPAAETQSAAVDIDLRLDSVMGLPFPGFPAAAAGLFQTARGMQEAALEGSVLEQFTEGSATITTAVLMEKALLEGVELKVVRSADTGGLALPAHVRRMLAAAVGRGHEVIIPARAIELSGAQRWGWWQVDPLSGETIGVMDNGLHSAMTDYNLDLTKIGLNDKTGLVIGAIVGATSTHITIAALLLKYGESGPALAKKVEEIIARITCLSCPEASASASASAGGSASISIGGDCFSKSKDKSVGGEAGAKVSVGSFCDAYVQGFKCASGLILHGLTVEVSASIGASIDADVSFGCD